MCEQASANPEHCLQCACLIDSAPIVHTVLQVPVALGCEAQDLTVRCLPYLNAMSVARSGAVGLPRCMLMPAAVSEQCGRGSVAVLCFEK